MFLPLKIVHPYQRTPYATIALLGTYLLAWILTLDGYPAGLMLDPDDLKPHQLITSHFLHDGWWHLAGNGLFLAVYGRYVEERLGALRFLAVFGACEVVSNMAYLAFGPDMPSLGASGAIAGMMGLVLVAAPWAEVECLFWFYVIVKRFKLAAFWLVGLWVFFQIWDVLTAGPFDRVAYSAHLGGVAAGCCIALYLKGDAVKGTPWWIDPAPPGGGKAASARLRKARGRHAAPVNAVAGKFGVVISALGSDTSPVALVKLLMRHAGLDPDEAMERVNAVRAGDTQRIGFDEQAQAAEFRDSAEAIGVEIQRRV